MFATEFDRRDAKGKKNRFRLTSIIIVVVVVALVTVLRRVHRVRTLSSFSRTFNHAARKYCDSVILTFVYNYIIYWLTINSSMLLSRSKNDRTRSPGRLSFFFYIFFICNATLSDQRGAYLFEGDRSTKEPEHHRQVRKTCFFCIVSKRYILFYFHFLRVCFNHLFILARRNNTFERCLSSLTTR